MPAATEALSIRGSANGVADPTRMMSTGNANRRDVLHLRPTNEAKKPEDTIKIPTPFPTTCNNDSSQAKLLTLTDPARLTSVTSSVSPRFDGLSLE